MERARTSCGGVGASRICSGKVAHGGGARRVPFAPLCEVSHFLSVLPSMCRVWRRAVTRIDVRQHRLRRHRACRHVDRCVGHHGCSAEDRVVRGDASRVHHRHPLEAFFEDGRRLSRPAQDGWEMWGACERAAINRGSVCAAAQGRRVETYKSASVHTTITTWDIRARPSGAGGVGKLLRDGGGKHARNTGQ